LLPLGTPLLAQLELDSDFLQRHIAVPTAPKEPPAALPTPLIDPEASFAFATLSGHTGRVEGTQVYLIKQLRALSLPPLTLTPLSLSPPHSLTLTTAFMPMRWRASVRYSY